MPKAVHHKGFCDKHKVAHSGRCAILSGMLPFKLLWYYYNDLWQSDNVWYYCWYV